MYTLFKSIVCFFKGHDDVTKSLVTTRGGDRYMWAHVCERCGRCERANEMYDDNSYSDCDPVIYRRMSVRKMKTEIALKNKNVFEY